MSQVIPLSAARPCHAPTLPANDLCDAPHIDVDDGMLGCALRAIGALLWPCADDNSAHTAIALLRRMMPVAPGELCPEVQVRSGTLGLTTQLDVSETLDGALWLPIASVSIAARSSDRSTEHECLQLSPADARALVAVWVAFADRPRLVSGETAQAWRPSPRTLPPRWLGQPEAVAPMGSLLGSGDQYITGQAIHGGLTAR